MAETEAAFFDRIAAEIADIETEWEALPPGEAVATSDPMPFTLDKLAVAMRGMPRDASIMIRLPGGQLAEIDHVTATYTRADGTQTTASGDHGRYTLVLVPE